MGARDVRSMTEIDRGVDTKTSPTEAETVEVPARPDGGEPSQKERKKRRTITIFKWAVPLALVEWVVLIGSALVIALLIKTFLFQAFYIPSESMRPTLNVGDRVLVNKMSYRLHDVNRGDIVVFETPPNAEDANGRIKDLVKRVIALPGETIETRDGVVHVNGRQLEEPYLRNGVKTCAPNSSPGTCADVEPTVIPSDHVFVMGDNRGASKDGRSFGAIEESSIVGRVFVRIWPLNDLGFL
jgi:signal peptidase I